MTEVGEEAGERVLWVELCPPVEDILKPLTLRTPECDLVVNRAIADVIAEMRI